MAADARFNWAGLGLVSGPLPRPVPSLAPGWQGPAGHRVRARPRFGQGGSRPWALRTGPAVPG